MDRKIDISKDWLGVEMNSHQWLDTLNHSLPSNYKLSNAKCVIGFLLKYKTQGYILEVKKHCRHNTYTLTKRV